MRTWGEVLTILLYFAAGAAFYSRLEGWTITQSIYFQVVTVTTVGYGDIHPVSYLGKLGTIAWALVGIGYIGVLIADLASKFGNRLDEMEKSVGPHATVDVAAKRRECVLKAQIAISSVVLVVLIGTVATMYLEGWPGIDALYWCCISTLTIGYGDKAPKNPATYKFAIVYLLTSTVIVAGAIGQLCSLSAELEQEKKRSELVHRALDPAWLMEMDDNGDGEVSKDEFIIAVLIKLGKVTHDDVQPWLERFDELDEDHSGTLDADDLHRIMNQNPLSRGTSVVSQVQQQLPTLGGG